MQGIVKPKSTAVTQYSVPAFLREEDPLFIKFVEYYYDWMSQTGNALDYIQNLIEYRGIETTTSTFLQLIISQLMPFIPAAANVNRELIASHIKDFYKAKGTFPSYEFVMNLVYQQTLSITLYSDYVFRPSSNESSREAFMYVETALPWNVSNVSGSRISQTYPSTASAIIEYATETIINGNLFYALSIDPKSVSGTFAVSGAIQVLDNTVNRSWTYVDLYYNAVSYSNNSLVVSVTYETPRIYNNLVVKQLGSDFRGIITSLSSRLLSNNQYVLTFTLNTVTGTFGTGEIYFVDALIENQVYTSESFYYGAVSPTINGINITNPGSLAKYGDIISYTGGSGSQFAARVYDVGGGPVENINIISGGYGYSVGDPIKFSVIGGNSLSAIVSGVDGMSASFATYLELDNFNIRNGGVEYAVGDVITIQGGQCSSADFPISLTVSSINNTLALNSIKVTSGGIGYQYVKLALLDNDTNTLVSGFSASATLQYGIIQSVSISSYPTLSTSNVSVLVNGAGADITATVSSGVITTTNIVSGGFNYVNPQIVVNSSQTPTTQAQFEITTNANGIITGVTIINGGVGYSPTVTLSVVEMYGQLASLTPIVNNTTGPITGFTISQRGNYSAIPLCFNTPYTSNSVNGSGLILDLKFKVKSINLANPGYYYRLPAIDASYGVGKGAVIVPEIFDGVVSSISVTASGSGYTYVSVSIVGTGNGFSGAASISGGGIASIIVYDGGEGYSNTDTVVFNGDGIGAAASITVENGVVKQIVVLNGGENYAYDTTIQYQMDPVLNPSAVAGIFTPIIENGVIKNISVISGGVGYYITTNDLLQEDGTHLLLEDGITYLEYISPYDQPNAQSGEPASITVDVAQYGLILDSDLTSEGSGYFSITEVTPIQIKVNSTTGKGAVIIPFLENGVIIKCNILRSGTNYQSTDTITVNGGGGLNASLTPLVYNGRIVDVLINNGGSSYKYGTSALVLGNGENAILSCNVNTSITNVAIFNGGIDYTNPVLSISDPTGSGAILEAVVDGYGSIVGVNVVYGGVGYTNPTISVTGGIGSDAILHANVPRFIESVDIITGGRDYTYAEVFVLGDGSGATVNLTLEDNGSIYNPDLVYSGTGYVDNPNIIVSDISGYGAVSEVSILDGGSNFTETPVVYLDNKYDIQGNLIATGARFVSYGTSIGSVRGIEFTEFGGDWYENPKFQFPASIIMQTNSNFTPGEIITVKDYPYTQQDTLFGILLEDGSTYLWSDYMIAPLAQEDDYLILNEDGTKLYVEDTGAIDQEYYEIVNSDGTTSAYYDAGPQAQVYNVDYSRNILEIWNSTESLIIITEDGLKMTSENEIPLVDQISNGFYQGDIIVGSQSNSESIIEWFNRPYGISLQGGIGFTKNQMQNTVGVIDNPQSKIHDGKRIQDYSYVVRTGLSLDTYKNTLVETVHPAGYAMYGDVVVGTYGGGNPISVPYSFGIKGADASFTSLINIKNSFVDTSLMKYLNFWYYNITKEYWYTTAAEKFADYTFDNYDITSLSFISNHAPLAVFEPWVAKSFFFTGIGVSAGSDLATGFSSTTGINIGYRVIAYDSNGNDVFIENKIENEDGTYLLNEDGTYLDTDELMVVVENIISSTEIQTSKYFGSTTSVSVAVQNIPSLWLN